MISVNPQSASRDKALYCVCHAPSHLHRYSPSLVLTESSFTLFVGIRRLLLTYMVAMCGTVGLLYFQFVFGFYEY